MTQPISLLPVHIEGFRLFKFSRLSAQDKVSTVETKNAIPANAAAIRVPLGSPFQRSTRARYVMPVPTTTNAPRTNKLTFLTFSLRVIMLAPDRSFIGPIPTSIMASNQDQYVFLKADALSIAYRLTAIDLRNNLRLMTKNASPMPVTARNSGQTVSRPAPR
jgi:hypothetical protein